METTRLSSKGQVIIPKAVRSAHQWGVGLELEVIEMGDGVLLRPKTLSDFFHQKISALSPSIPE